MSVPRSELIHRSIPSMELSSGSGTSKTAVPSPVPASLSPTDRALARFAVTGNALVAGGAGDIGLAACRALLEHGLSGLAILDLSSSAGDAAVASLRAGFPSATITFHRVDVTSASEVAAAISAAEDRLGGAITTCCIFAGIVGSAHALNLEPPQFRTMLDVNATGTFLVAQAAARAMVARGVTGSVVLTASISGAHLVNFPQPQAHYNAAKAAVLALKSSLAAEWARHGIRVNSVSPGYVDTVLNEGEGLEAHRREWARRTPWGRMGVSEEVTGAVVLLASRAGSYMTGADILVDGGISVF
ncbi:NAD(P)-binding domain protein [Cordyceps fumosorosea ARSEF 2679]|uniref:NAD(P)-binding domain protein n=1 Tax=Cordyceps fumosorosea (strain ARSEF 2679) TaxID=1081104 RepID=A0A168CD35_CORFA|nr:NAD(P)-binding domain protein [Cordyceps fumosorosea ARSEF 2679]OAA71240.1 NAD(P)-binding domain protein [Cordyceps fumosorosea ARSEF 2679]